MSTHLYRLWQPGNPQTRVFLPNMWMYLRKPRYRRPPNQVELVVHPEMTAHDVREYLGKIYRARVRDVWLRVEPGAISLDQSRSDEHQVPSYIKRVNSMHIPEYRRTLEPIKSEDKKIAYVMLHRDDVFEWPEGLFPTFQQQQAKMQANKDKMESHRSEAERTLTQRVKNLFRRKQTEQQPKAKSTSSDGYRNPNEPKSWF